MIDKTRHRHMKWYASEAEEAAVIRYCEENGTTKSELARAAVLREIAPPKPRPPAHRIRRGVKREGPKLGLRLPPAFAKRLGGAPIPLRI